MRWLAIAMIMAVGYYTADALGQAQPLQQIEFINATQNVEGTQLTDLAAVEFDCNGHRFTVATSEPGASLAEAIPQSVKDLSGAVTCIAWSVNAAGEPGPSSAPYLMACGGGQCFPLGLPRPPVLSGR